ncbi:MAG: hypothetical protein ACI4TI_00725 [Christensenellales bacterium]
MKSNFDDNKFFEPKLPFCLDVDDLVEYLDNISSTSCEQNYENNNDNDNKNI